MDIFVLEGKTLQVWPQPENLDPDFEPPNFERVWLRCVLLTHQITGAGVKFYSESMLRLQMPIADKRSPVQFMSIQIHTHGLGSHLYWYSQRAGKTTIQQFFWKINNGISHSHGSRYTTLTDLIQSTFIKPPWCVRKEEYCEHIKN